MKTTRYIIVLAVAGMLLSPLSHAGTFGTAIGSGVGAVAGAVIGDSMGGRNGAIIGSGIGGAMGAVVGQSVSQPSHGGYHYGGHAPAYGYQAREVHHYYHEAPRHPGRGHAWGHHKHRHHGHHGGY